MPPKKLHWPATEAEFDRLAEENKQKYLPLLRDKQVYELIGLNLALEVALKEIEPLARAEDARRGCRPSGTTVGR